MSYTNHCHSGDIGGVTRLMRECLVHVNTPNRLNQTPLCIACEQGHTQVARYLLHNGAYVSDYGRIHKPLIAAVRYNHYQCVKLLLEKHADANCHNSSGETPMSVAVQYHPNDIELILLLLQYDAVPSAPLADIAVQLLEHAKAEHTQAVIKMIDEKIIDLTSNIFPAAFQFAFQHGSMELAERMMSNDIYSRTEHRHQEAAVYYSAKKNWPDILSDLIGKGVNINALTEGQTPLSAACEGEYTDVVS